MILLKFDITVSDYLCRIPIIMTQIRISNLEYRTWWNKLNGCKISTDNDIGIQDFIINSIIKTNIVILAIRAAYSLINSFEKSARK